MAAYPGNLNPSYGPPHTKGLSVFGTYGVVRGAPNGEPVNAGVSRLFKPEGRLHWSWAPP